MSAIKRKDSATGYKTPSKPPLPKSGVKKTKLDEYLTISVLGQGTFAKVMLVKEIKTSKLYAMKVLRKSKIETLGASEKVFVERDVLAQITHPFIIQFYQSFRMPKKLYFILEYCPGGELWNLLVKKGKFTEEQVRFYSAQVLLALETLHAEEIIYRDLKPENILIDAQGYLRVTDFGLSRMTNIRGGYGVDSYVGTPEYFAPEVVMNQGYGKEVDLWAFGAILYEMLVGTPPFFSASQQELYAKIRFAEPSYPETMGAGAKNLIKALLRKQPARRLGAVKGIPEIKSHEWFKGMDFDQLLKKNYEPPFVPVMKTDCD